MDESISKVSGVKKTRSEEEADYVKRRNAYYKANPDVNRRRTEEELPDISEVAGMQPMTLKGATEAY